MERPDSVICRWPTGKTSSMSGTRLERRSVWRNLSRCTLRAPSNVMVTAPTITSRQRANAGRPVLLAGCWARARRYFYEALDHAPKEAGWILMQIGHLYEIERRLAIKRLAQRCERLIGPVRAGSFADDESMGSCNVGSSPDASCQRARWVKRSINGLGQWESLEVYLKESAIEIDTKPRGECHPPDRAGQEELVIFRRCRSGPTQRHHLLDHRKL
jgi:hypothetical protein